MKYVFGKIQDGSLMEDFTHSSAFSAVIIIY